MRVLPIDFVSKKIIHDSIDHLDSLIRFVNIQLMNINSQLVEYETTLNHECSIAESIINQAINSTEYIAERMLKAFETTNIFHEIITKKYCIIELAKVDMNNLLSHLKKGVDISDTILVGRFNSCKDHAYGRYQIMLDTLSRHYQSLHDDWLLYYHFKDRFKRARLICGNEA